MNMKQCINPEPQGHVFKTYISNFIKKYAPLYHLRHIIKNLNLNLYITLLKKIWDIVGKPRGAYFFSKVIYMS